MTNPLRNEKIEQRWDNFMLKIKSELSDKNKHYQKIKDINDKNQKQLHEIINKQVVGFSVSWTVEDNYEISEITKKEINEIFDNA